MTTSTKMTPIQDLPEGTAIEVQFMDLFSPGTPMRKEKWRVTGETREVLNAYTGQMVTEYAIRPTHRSKQGVRWERPGALYRVIREKARA